MLLRPLREFSSIACLSSSFAMDEIANKAARAALAKREWNTLTVDAFDECSICLSKPEVPAAPMTCSHVFC